MKKNTRAERMTLAEAAEELGLCKRTVQNAINKGLLEPITHGLCGKTYWVTARSVKALLKQIGGR